MKQVKQNQRKLITASILCFALLAACTKDRPTQFSQGQGTNLQAISDYQDKSFPIQIGDAIGSSTVTVAKSVKVSSDVGSINNLPIVSFKTEAKLLGDTPIRARAGRPYEVRYKLTNNYLKIMLVGNKEDIPSDQWSYAEPQQDGRLAVPLLGYRILSYYRIEHAKDSNNADTNTLIEMPETVISRATHFKVDFNSRTVYHPEDKTDVYPATVFDGEWYYSQTITDASVENNSNIGINYYSVDESLKPAQKIRFVKSEKTIRAVNTNIDDRLDKSNDINFKSALNLPVSWIEYQSRKNGTEDDLSEEQVQTNKWSKRPYVKVSFDQVSTPAGNFENANLADLELAQNFISFTLESGNRRIKFAFVKVAPTSYVGKRHFEDDFKAFGFFTTEKAVFQNYQISRKEDHEKNIFISRFDPKRKDITFHFTASSPQWLRDIGRQSIAAWDKAFKEAGSTIDVKLDESFDVNLGDIRYNAINMVESLDDQGQTGLGESLTNPDTGEIIAVTANIYVTPSIAGIHSDLKHYIYSQLGIYDQSIIAKGSEGILATINPASQASEQKSPLIKDLLQKGVDQKNLFSSPIKSMNDLWIKPKAAKNFPGADCRSITVTPANIVKNIQSKCSEIDDYIASLKQQKITHDAREQAVLNSCARKLVLSDMLGTLLHEMGHTFGLRHNFTASNDVDNFRSASETNTDHIIEMSSVMDYPGNGGERPPVLGKYDVAAIRYGYSDQVESDTGKIISLKTEKSIKDNLAEQGVNRRPYKFCTDDDVELGTDPMCARWDNGKNPSEVVQNIIDSYYALYTTTNYRYDRYRNANEEALLGYKANNTFEPLKRFYDQWRFYLGQYVGLGKEYLEELDPDAYAQVLDSMSKDPVFGKYYKEYYPASRKAYEFLRNIAMLPNRYCVVKNSDDNGEKTKLIELEKIRDEVFRNSNISVKSCSDEAVKKYLANQELRFVKELGYSLNNVRYDQSLSAVQDPYDIVGVRYDRMMAFLSLASRNQGSLIHQSKKFYPNFLDEPDLKKDIATNLMPRLINGLLLSDVDTKKYFIKFEYEKDLLAIFTSLYRYGSMIPGKDNLNMTRDAAFEVNITQQQQLTEGAQAVTKIGSYFVAAMDQQNFISAALIKKHLQLLQVAQITDVNPQIFRGLKSFFDKLPASADADKMTVAQFKQIMESYAKIVEQSPENVQSHLVAIASQEWQMYQSLAQALEQMSEQDAKKADELLNTKLKKVLDAQGIKYDFFKDTIQDKIKKYVTQVKQMVKTYAENKSDIDSQMDLIQKILFSGGQ